MHPRCDTGPPVPAVRTAPVGWVWGGFAPWPPIPKGWPDFCTLLARRRNWARGKFPLGLVGGVQEGAAPCPPAGSAVRVRGAAERGPAPRGQLGWVAKRCGHREGLSTASGVSATAHALSSSFPGESVSLLSFTFFLFLSFPLPLFSFPLCLLFIPSSPFYPFHPFPSCRSTACLQPFFWHCPAGRSANLVAERPHERSQLCWTEAAPRNKNSATFFFPFFFFFPFQELFSPPSLPAGAALTQPGKPFPLSSCQMLVPSSVPQWERQPWLGCAAPEELIRPCWCSASHSAVPRRFLLLPGRSGTSGAACVRGVECSNPALKGIQGGLATDAGAQPLPARAILEELHPSAHLPFAPCIPNTFGSPLFSPCFDRLSHCLQLGWAGKMLFPEPHRRGWGWRCFLVEKNPPSLLHAPGAGAA